MVYHGKMVKLFELPITRPPDFILGNRNLDTQLADVIGIDVSPDDDDILYITSTRRHVIQKVRLDKYNLYNISKSRDWKTNNGANVEASELYS